MILEVGNHPSVGFDTSFLTSTNTTTYRVSHFCDRRDGSDPEGSPGSTPPTPWIPVIHRFGGSDPRKDITGPPRTIPRSRDS
jgi:hypothetical protein